MIEIFLSNNLWFQNMIWFVICQSLLLTYNENYKTTQDYDVFHQDIPPWGYSLPIGIFGRLSSQSLGYVLRKSDVQQQ